jgi:hypothetical protein
VREVYIVATRAAAPVDFASLEDDLESESLVFTGDEEGWGFQLQLEEGVVDVRFEVRDTPLGWTPDLITGNDEALGLLRQSRGFYRIAFEVPPGNASVAVVEALMCARAILQRVSGVLLDITAYKLHDAQDVTDIVDLDFDIRDHINLHAQQVTEGDTPLWVHTHGMEKFGCRNVEMFHLNEADLTPAESFLHELCTDLALGQGPAERALVETSEGQTFMLLRSEEARVKLMGVPLDVFEGHEGLFLTIVSAEGRHTASELLRPYRDRFGKEDPEHAHALADLASELLPAFKTRFLRKGLMEPLTFLVRAPFQTHPEGEAVQENLWAEVLAWDEERVVGRLIDGSSQTTEWRKGAQVEVAQGTINALVLTREGRPLDEQEMRSLLNAERPS